MPSRSATTEGFALTSDKPKSRYARFLLWRNRLLRSASFQKWAARLPLSQSIARQRATDLHRILAGFVYSPTLSASYKLGLLECLKDRIATLDEIADYCEPHEAAAVTPVAAAVPVHRLETVDMARGPLGELGASSHGNPGGQSRLGHHDLLYSDMADPAQLLRRRENASLRGYWPYVDGDHNDPAAAARYSELMADSQHLIANHILDSISLTGTSRLLDVGGGTGTFARLAADRFPHSETAVFDLPQVIASIPPKHSQQLRAYSGDMFNDALPEGFNAISLVRILHDHDDLPVERLLARCFDALPSGGQIIIAEPMAGTRGAESMGHTYFGIYLRAMGSGSPRENTELYRKFEKASFAGMREKTTHNAKLGSCITGTKPNVIFC